MYAAQMELLDVESPMARVQGELSKALMRRNMLEVEIQRLQRLKAQLRHSGEQEVTGQQG